MILSKNWSDIMYMSRIRLNTESRNTQLALVSPSKIHGAVETCFVLKEERKLWRIDQLGGKYYLLLLSPEKPSLIKIKEQFGYPEEPDEIKNYDNLLDRAVSGSIWQFRLTANPTRSVKKEGERGKVTAHVSESYQMEWLYRKAANHGFSICSEGSCVVGIGWKNFYKNGEKQKVRLKEVTYQGILRVEDEELFRSALINGIGRGKAYGMGLLTIMRV